MAGSWHLLPPLFVWLGELLSPCSALSADINHAGARLCGSGVAFDLHSMHLCAKPEMPWWSNGQRCHGHRGPTEGAVSVLTLFKGGSGGRPAGREWSGIGTGCPRKWWGHVPGGVQELWTWLMGMVGWVGVGRGDLSGLFQLS